MIQVESMVTSTSSEPSEIVVVELRITLDKEHADKYIKLDTMLHENQDDEYLADLVSDYGFSYSNDVLSTIYWDRLEDLYDVVDTYLLLQLVK